MKKRTFIKIIALMLVAVFAFAITGCSTNEGDENGDLLARIKAKGSISIATEGDWPPYTYHDESDKLVGFDVELGKLIAEKLGVTADFVETDWDSILAGVESGRFDIACNGVGYTEKRAESYNFSNPYAYTYTVLVVRGDNEDIKTFTDLNGKTTANTASSTYAEIAEGYGATVLPVTTLADTIELLTEGRIDATVNSEEAIADYLSQNPDANIKIVARDVGEILAIPSAKNDDTKTLIEEINKIIAELNDNGKLSEISVKYFNTDLTKAK